MFLSMFSACLHCTAPLQVLNDKNELVDITRSRLAGAFRVTDFATDDWEVDPTDLDIRQKLGEGEFGTVHLAFWHGTVVAVKILRKSDDVALGDFKTELNILMKVHHPHTVQFMGACTKQQPYMLITEFLPGGSLADLFRLVRLQEHVFKLQLESFKLQLDSLLSLTRPILLYSPLHLIYKKSFSAPPLFCLPLHCTAG